MDEPTQRDVDKAHGAVGYASRTVEACRDTIARLDDKIAKATAALADAQAARAEAEAELAAAEAELVIRSADPALALPSSQGGTSAAAADPATGTGGN